MLRGMHRSRRPEKEHIAPQPATLAVPPARVSQAVTSEGVPVGNPGAVTRRQSTTHCGGPASLCPYHEREMLERGVGNWRSVRSLIPHSVRVFGMLERSTANRARRRVP